MKKPNLWLCFVGRDRWCYIVQTLFRPLQTERSSSIIIRINDGFGKKKNLSRHCYIPMVYSSVQPFNWAVALKNGFKSILVIEMSLAVLFLIARGSVPFFTVFKRRDMYLDGTLQWLQVHVPYSQHWGTLREVERWGKSLQHFSSIKLLLFN